MASGIDLTAKAEFNRMKTVLFVAKAKGQYIGKEWTLTTDPSQACPIHEIYDRIMTFLQRNQINTHNGLHESDVTAFRDNLVDYAQSNHGIDLQSTQKLKGIVRLLRHQHATESLQQILKQGKLGPSDKVQLKRVLSLLAVEIEALLKFLSSLEDSILLESLMSQAVERELSHPNSLEPSDMAWIVFIQLPRADSLKGVTSQDFKDPVRLKKIIVQLLLLQRDMPEAVEVCETSLMILTLMERMKVNDRVLLQFMKSVHAINSIGSDLNLYDYYEISPQFKVIHELILDYSRATVYDKEKVIQSFGDRQIDLKSDPVFCKTLIDAEQRVTKKFHELALNMFDAYAEQCAHKRAFYTRMHQKIDPSGKQVLHNSLYPKNAPLLATPSQFLSQPLTLPTVEETEIELLRRQIERKEIDLDALAHQLGPLVAEPAPVVQASCSSDPVPEVIQPGIPVIRWVDIVKRAPSLSEPGSSSSCLTPEQREMQQLERYFAQRAGELPLFPRSGLELNEEVLRLFEERLNVNPWRTFSAAWDAAQSRYLTTMSLRMFCLNPEATKQAALHGFVGMEIDRGMVKRLHRALTAYHKGQELNADHIQYTFSHFFVRLFQVPHGQERITERFKTLRGLFQETLSEGQWKELERYIRAQKPVQEEVEAIVRKETSRRSLLMMPMLNLTCGEVKIALDCIRQLQSLSVEKRRELPPTLSERLTFLTIRNVKHKTDAMKSTHLTNAIEKIKKIGAFEVAVFNVCNKCDNIWPVLEALYATELSGR